LNNFAPVSSAKIYNFWQTENCLFNTICIKKYLLNIYSSLFLSLLVGSSAVAGLVLVTSFLLLPCRVIRAGNICFVVLFICFSFYYYG